MADHYDNERGVYIEDEGLMQGHWFVTEEGFLYIVPNPLFDIIDSVGPGDDIEDQLNEAIGGDKFFELDPKNVAMSIGVDYINLDLIDPVLKRFDPEVGYFVA